MYFIRYNLHNMHFIHFVLSLAVEILCTVHAHTVAFHISEACAQVLISGIEDISAVLGGIVPAVHSLKGICVARADIFAATEILDPRSLQTITH